MKPLKLFIKICILTGLILTLSSLPSVALPGLNLTKTCNTISANLGDTVTYTFHLRNNGTEPLNDPMLMDDRLGEIPLNRSLLEAGGLCNASVSHLIIESDLPGPLKNVARATARCKESIVLSNNASFAISLGISGYENLSKYEHLTSTKL
jgi:uncharacterized repeat protein (TIGR01451 family)